ncbi:MAG: bifunctional 4-hydroxy-2-oxoglutarate aldolase/2-dehydro-3-deoxy-phosphogluconate aldolase [Actinobacteria bacterium]|nr:bifunctional 4-hydroxy-2-oxoglutarate aldolase/2-dehydro-3-deoxy-phosphogluconate aldolase [Actinomycetota bacterium]
MTDSQGRFPLAEILAYRVVPVLVIRNAADARAVGEALVNGGLPVVEVTLRTPASWDAVGELKKVDGLIVGVGSVKSPEDIVRAKDEGLAFAVSPGLLAPIAEMAEKCQLSFLPGVSTPSEIMLALSLGFNVVKWFPAEALGGITSLKAIAAPFPDLKFVPTGGVNLSNMASYLQEKFVSAIGGSWMVSAALVESQNRAEMSGLTKSAIESASQIGK